MANSMRLTLLLTATDQMTRTVTNAARSSMAAMSSMQAGMQRRANMARTAMLDSGMAFFGGTQLLKMPLQAAGNFERLRISMNALTGSMQKGGAVYKQVVDLAKDTPLTLEQVAQNTTVLLGMGDAAETVVGNIKMLGDITALTNGDLARAAVAYGQARQMGKLLTRDIYQMINAGIPLKKMFDDVYGAGFDLYGAAERGELTFESLQHVLNKATSAGGQFYDGLGKLRASLDGTTNALRSEYQMTLASIGETVLPMVKGAMEGLIIVLRSVGDFFREYPSLAKGVMILVGAFTALSGIALIVNGAVYLFSTIMAGAGGKLMIFAYRMTGLKFIVTQTRFALHILKNTMILLWKDAVIPLAKSMWARLIPSISSAVTWVRNLTAVQWLLNAALAPLTITILAVTAVIAWMAYATYKVINGWKEWGAAASFLLGPFGSVIQTIMSLKMHWQSIVDAFTTGGILSGIIRIGQVLLDAILYPLQQLMEIAAKLTGFDIFKKASKSMYDLRAKMDLTEATKATSAVASASGQSITNQSISNSSTSSTIAPVSSGGTSFNYSPVLNIATGVSESAIATIVENDRREFAKQMEDVMRRKAERRYA